MKRWVRTILIFLLLGAILNVAVAWGLAVIVPISAMNPDRIPDYDTPIPVLISDLHNSLLPPELSDVTPTHESRLHFGYRSYSIVSSVTEYGSEQDGSGTNVKKLDVFFIHADESGWPFPSLWHYISTEVHQGTSFSTPIITVDPFGNSPLDLSSIGINKQVHLPFFVRFWGSSGNTLFYATILWALFRIMMMLRRRKLIWTVLIFLTSGTILNVTVTCLLTLYKVRTFIASSLQGGSPGNFCGVGTPVECIFFNYGFHVSYLPQKFYFTSWSYSMDWIGFSINVIDYAVLLWLLILVPFILRRRRRVRRGLCVKCAYPVSVNAGLPHASPHCPECGTPISGTIMPKE